MYVCAAAAAHADVNAALVHTLGLLVAHTLHTLNAGQQQVVIRCVHVRLWLWLTVSGVWLWSWI